MEVASDNGMAPVTGNTPSTDVGGLIAAVESKMAELMAWHAQQTKQLETDKTVLQAQADKQREEIEAERKGIAGEREQVASERADLQGQRKQLDDYRAMLNTREADLDKNKNLLTERTEQIEQQRIKLVELTSKLRAEESALSREWSEVHNEREALRKLMAEVAEQRERVNERAKSWLEETATQLSTPLKLAGTEENSEDGTPSDSKNAA